MCRRKAENENTCYRRFRIHREMGWQPEISFEDGMRKTIEYYVGRRTIGLDNDMIQ